ncbi:hypothetical protein M0805_000092 [Coniferiporia weirii]|nr:hypothetical protein M0805_000092 [Coniferiporia weirii]
MPLDHAIKRPVHEVDIKITANKRPKLESDEEFAAKPRHDVNGNRPGSQVTLSSKLLTRGVERVTPYPEQCRPNVQNNGWHRRQLVKNVTKRLADQGKRVIGIPRFLDDGVVFDWLLDKSIGDPGSDDKKSTEDIETPIEAIKNDEIPESGGFLGASANRKNQDLEFLKPRLLRSDASLPSAQGASGGDTNIQGNPLVISDPDDANMQLNNIRIESHISLEVDAEHENEKGMYTSTPVSGFDNGGEASDLEDTAFPSSFSEFSSIAPVSISGHDQPEQAVVQFMSPSFEFENLTETFPVTDEASSDLLNDNDKHSRSPRADNEGLQEQNEVPHSEQTRTFIRPEHQTTTSRESVEMSGHIFPLEYSDSDSSHTAAVPSVNAQTPPASNDEPTRLEQVSRTGVPTPPSYLKNLRHPLPPRPRTDGTEDIIGTPNRHRYSSLREIDWINYKSIVFIKNLPQTSTIEDVYDYLRTNGYPFERIEDVQIHNARKPIVSVQFLNPRDAQNAIRVLEMSTTPFSIPFEGPSHLTRGRIRFERCDPPKRHSAGSLARRVTIAPSLPTTLSRRTRTQGSQIHTPAVPPSAPRPPKSRDPPSARPAPDKQSQSKRVVSGHSHPPPVEVRESSGALPDGQAGGGDAINISSGLNKDVEDDNTSTTSSSEDSSESDSDTDRTEEDARNTRRSEGPKGEGERIIVAARLKQCTRVQVPKVSYGRPRRLILPSDRPSPLLTVTMRGDIQFIDQTSRKRIANLSLPALNEASMRVEDACLMEGAVVLGCSKGNSQASIVVTSKANSKPSIHPLPNTPHSEQGISCLAPFIPSDSTGFLSGGFDKTVQRWCVSQNRPDSGDTRSGRQPDHSATVRLLGGPFNSLITYHVSTHVYSVYSAAEFSNAIHQIHVHKKNPNVIIVEVDHLLQQIQVHDVRKRYRGRPEQEFGYGDTSASGAQIRARHRRGDTNVNYFARGFDDGTVCLWDYRKHKTTVTALKCDEPVWHTVFSDRKTSNVWAYAGSVVTYLDLDLSKQHTMT